MKFNTLRYLALPWFLFFCAVIATMIVEGTKIYLGPEYDIYYQGVFVAGILVCLFFNLRTLSKAGIWLADSLPYSVRRKPWVSYVKATLAILIAGAAYSVGQLGWVPVFWQGFVIPITFMICLFVTVWNLMGPLLIFCSRLAFSCLSAFVFSWPVFALVPITALFLGNSVVKAYQESRPDFAFSRPSTSAPVVATDGAEEKKEESITATHKTALELQEAAATASSCSQKGKLVQANLTSDGDADIVYWAIRAAGCANLKNVIALSKLADIMMKHPNALVRAAAINQMASFDRESVKRIGYLLVKRMGESEPPQVIEAAAGLLLKLGEDEKAWVSKKMTVLLNIPKTSVLAAKILVSKLKREDLITEFVTKNLSAASSQKERAISMICSLSEPNRMLAVPHIDLIMASIKKADMSDPAVKALECLGQPSLDSLRREIAKPEKIDKLMATKVFAQSTWKDKGAVLETSSKCVRDSDEETRQWCGQALGKVGVAAIPTILELLKSNEATAKESATHALTFFTDNEAKEELIKERTKNSGWMANQKNLELARAIDQALLNMH